MSNHGKLTLLTASLDGREHAPPCYAYHDFADVCSRAARMASWRHRRGALRRSAVPLAAPF